VVAAAGEEALQPLDRLRPGDLDEWVEQFGFRLDAYFTSLATAPPATAQRRPLAMMLSTGSHEGSSEHDPRLSSSCDTMDTWMQECRQPRRGTTIFASVNADHRAQVLAIAREFAAWARRYSMGAGASSE
jgi:hypothetical protein